MDFTVPGSTTVFKMTNSNLRLLISEICKRESTESFYIDLKESIIFKNGTVLNKLAGATRGLYVQVLVNLDPVEVMHVPARELIKRIKVVMNGVKE